MVLRFNGAWRFNPPENGHYYNRSIPYDAVEEFIAMVAKVATQDSRQGILEHFKSHFCGALGTAHSRSFNESWAESDLRDVMHSAADNAPLFIEAFFDACEDLRRRNRDWFVPDPTLINPILIKHGIGYDIRPPDLLLREHETQPVSVPERPPTLAERAVTVFQASLHRSEQLLSEGRPREAVQEILWLLETVTTAFRGIETDSGTAEGKYFNQIVRYLRSKRPGTTLDRVLEWITSVPDTCLRQQVVAFGMVSI